MIKLGKTYAKRRIFVFFSHAILTLHGSFRTCHSINVTIGLRNSRMCGLFVYCVYQFSVF